MALFTLKPAIVTKQIAATFTIDYNELAALSAVPVGYYKTISNWKEVFIRMKHNGSNQKGTLHFKLPGTNADLLLTDAARAGTWSVDSIVIKDYDKGEVPVFASQIPSVTDYDILVQSNATNGDLYVAAGQTVVIPAGSKKQYGDFVIEAGGTLEIGDGGGITEFEINESCVINGTIKANNGKHLAGTWSTTSVLGESLSYSIAQKLGGDGGNGQASPGAPVTVVDGFGSMYQTNKVGMSTYTGNIQVGDAVTLNGTPGYTVASILAPGSGDLFTVTPNHGFPGSIPPPPTQPILITRNIPVPGGNGGTALNGNGAGGGRSSMFGALVGGNASLNIAGVGAGQDDPAANSYGVAGAPSLTASEAGSGGFRGAHGQGIYIKARKIQGTGTINAGGQKGGDGGNGGQYNSGGIFYGNGAGGGAAGGSGAKIWLRYKIGTPSLTLNVNGGDKGNRGTRPNTNVVEAGHGEVGDAGSTSLATW